MKNTLASWIDLEAVAGMAEEMAPPPTAETLTWMDHTDTPVTRLVADDFRLPGHFAQEPFPLPAAGSGLPAPELSKVRNFLEEIRQKAQQSGLIQRPAESAGALTAPGPSAAPPPGDSHAFPPPPLSGPVTIADHASYGPAAPPVLSPLRPLAAPAPAGLPVARAAFPPGPAPATSNAPAAGFPVSPTTPRSPLPLSTPPGTRHPLHLPPLGTSVNPPSGPLPASAPAPSFPISKNPDQSPPTGFDTFSGVPPLRRHVPHFEVPLGPMTTRLRALTDWIRRQIDSADIFIVDSQGGTVGDREAVGEILTSAILLAEAARRASAHLPDSPSGALYLDLEDERRLCVINTPTQHGNFTLGLIVPDALAPRAADRLRRALKRTVEAETPSPLTLPPRERW